MKKSKMKRLKKLEYAFTHGCDVEVFSPAKWIPVNYTKRPRCKPVEWKWTTIHTLGYLRLAFVRNMWLKVVPKEGITYCDVVEEK